MPDSLWKWEIASADNLVLRLRRITGCAIMRPTRPKTVFDKLAIFI